MSESVTSIPQHVIFVGTSTDEKIRDLNAIAQAKGLPMHFFNLKKVVGAFNNVEETGLSAEANANLKQKNIVPQKNKCRKNPKLIKDFCEKRGIEFAPERTWFCAEDSGLSIPKELWKHIDVRAISQEVRERIANQKTPAPGVETAPILSSWLGARNAYTHITHAIDKEKQANTQFDENKSLFQEVSWLNLENMQNPQIVCNSIGQVSTHFTRADNAFKTSPRFTTYDFMRPIEAAKDKQGITAKDLGLYYISHQSARARALHAMVTEINATTPPAHNVDRLAYDNDDEVTRRRTQYQYMHSGIKSTPSDFSVGFVNTQNPKWKKLLGDKFAAQGLSHQRDCLVYEPVARGLSDLKKAEFILSYPERALAHNDGIVLLPDEGADKPLSLKEKLYTLMSLVVAKQLVVRDMDKPFIIINTDHSWDKAIEIHNSLANANLTKDHVIPISPKLPDVRVESNAYFHVISSPNPKAPISAETAVHAAAALMKDESLSYYRHTPESVKPRRCGVAPKDKSGGVVILCSASCENTSLNAMVRSLTHKLAQKDTPIYYGAGDKYTMGAVPQGVEDCRQETGREHKLIGFSTPEIVISETRDGKLPKSLTYGREFENIYARMAHLLYYPDSHLVTTGGAGSLQEWMGSELLRERMKDVFAKKKLVILDPGLMDYVHEPDEVAKHGKKQFEVSYVYDKILRAVYDKEYTALTVSPKFLDMTKGLHQRHVLHNQRGLFIAHNEDEALQALAHKPSRAVPAFAM